MTLKKYMGNLLYKVFHENTKNFYFGEDKEFQQIAPKTWNKTEYKSYPTSQSIKLEDPSPSDIDELFHRRESAEEFSEHKISKSEIENLLLDGAGIAKRENSSNRRKRTYPSAGARYPLEIYIAIINGNDLEEGLYHYNVLENKLEWINGNTDFQEWEFIDLDSFENISVITFITAIPERTVQKYGNRGYRYILIEAGHLMQNFCLKAEKLNLSCRPYSHFLEDDLDEYLELDEEEISIYAGIIGKPSSNS